MSGTRKARTTGPRLGPRVTAPQPATPPTIVQIGGDRTLGGAREVDFAQLTPDPEQPRKQMHPERLAELAASIVTHGLLQPIVVRQAGLDQHGDMRYIVVAGGRRYAAIQLALAGPGATDEGLRARLTRVPVIINDSPEAERRVLQLIENLQREDLNPVEEARALKEIANIEGLTTNGVAQRVHRSQGYVDERLRLLRHEDVEDAVETGLLTKSAGAAIASIRAADDRRAWLERARQGEVIRPREVYASKPDRRPRPKRQLPAPPPADPDAIAAVTRRATALRAENGDLSRAEALHLAAVEARESGRLDAATATRAFGLAGERTKDEVRSTKDGEATEAAGEAAALPNFGSVVAGALADVAASNTLTALRALHQRLRELRPPRDAGLRAQLVAELGDLAELARAAALRLTDAE
ncbi:MAG TPA: ParB/RepB/Spo0J family partition protein [Thermomicrobiales bacterium]|jgi:ParB family chromosome partitioning protein|nr:ParB/RepB/Spo0J family partition protein [Thermomicrobiales bacterium]